MKNEGCLGALLYVFALASIAIGSVVLGVSMDAIGAGIFSVCISGFVCFAVFSSLFAEMSRGKAVLFVSSIIAGAVALFLFFTSVFNIEVFENERPKISIRTFATTAPKQSTADRYRSQYPMTWGYISRNAEDPYEYIEYYDSVWGDLQVYHGDGIIFNTLSSKEQALVNYPEIGAFVYKANSGATTYHSTRMCYTLLKSEPVFSFASVAHSLEPCSKCVGD